MALVVCQVLEWVPDMALKMDEVNPRSTLCFTKQGRHVWLCRGHREHTQLRMTNRTLSLLGHHLPVKRLEDAPIRYAMAPSAH